MYSREIVAGLSWCIANIFAILYNERHAIISRFPPTIAGGNYTPLAGELYTCINLRARQLAVCYAAGTPHH